MKIAVKNRSALAALLLFAAATLATAYAQTQPIASQMAHVAAAEKPALTTTLPNVPGKSLTAVNIS